jgi:hypothetical protein
LNEPRMEDLLARTDPFMTFFIQALGTCNWNIEICFASRPPQDCITYEMYKPYILPAPRYAYTMTDMWVCDLSCGRLNLNRIINMSLATNESRFLHAAASTTMGEIIRKTMMSNPTRAVATKVATSIANRDEIRSYKNLVFRIGVWLRRSSV